MTTVELPPTLTADLRRLTETELSLPSRLRYVGLLLAALAMTAIAGSLGLTEPHLPARTRIAFSAMTLIGLAWAAFAGWVLTRERILLAPHRIVAGRLSVTACALFTLGALGVGLSTTRPAAYLAAGTGLLMVAVAAFLLRRAHRAFALLTERRAALALELGRSGAR